MINQLERTLSFLCVNNHKVFDQMYIYVSEIELK